MTNVRMSVHMQDIYKVFGTITANRGATIQVTEGEIHALVGENGAGKSTLMRILSGLIAPDAGQVKVNGRDVTGWSTQEAIAAGVGMVHQHFMLVPALTVAENVILGKEPAIGPIIDRKRAALSVRELCSSSGLQVDPDARVADLSVGEAQRVEIVKVLYRGARILILDEPTAVLSPPEVDQLWTMLRALRNDGCTIVLITHKLDEVFAIADTITVLRKGRTIARRAASKTTAEDIALAIVGRRLSLHEKSASTRNGQRHVDRTVPPMLTIDNLVVHNDRGTVAVNSLSFDIAAGEILGIAGVEGNGQSELVEAIAGIRKIERGKVIMREHALHNMHIRERAERGLAHIPEDRQRHGLVLDYSIEDNLILGQQHRFSRLRGLDRKRIVRHAQELIREYDIRPAVRSLPVRSLSGGNQQKVVLARELGGREGIRVLIAAQPTRGVDAGATEFIHTQILKARDAGNAVLLVSADLQEVLALSDRIAVMYGGRFATILPASECSVERLGPFMTGAVD